MSHKYQVYLKLTKILTIQQTHRNTSIQSIQGSFTHSHTHTHILTHATHTTHTLHTLSNTHRVSTLLNTLSVFLKGIIPSQVICVCVCGACGGGVVGVCLCTDG